MLPFSKMPGEHSFKVMLAIRNALQQAPSNKSVGIFEGLHQKHGKILRMKLPGQGWIVSTQSIEDAELMFQCEGDLPSRGIHEDNLMWIYKRSTFLLQCSSHEFLKHLESQMGECNILQDIVPEINKWSFQGVSYFVYGEKINMYTNDDPIHQEFIEAGLEYIRSVGDIASAIPIYKIFPTKTYRDYVNIVHRIHAIGTIILKSHSGKLKESILKGEVSDSEAVGLLDQWIIEGKFTEKEALSQSYDMLSAGIDTTTNTSAFLLFELARHPQIQQLVKDEISSVLGDKSSPSWEDLQKMSTIRNCIKETMRLYMPISGIGRILSRNGVFSGYEVPAGTPLAADYASIARNEEYISEPHKFIPQRWSKNTEEKLHPFLSLPFGFGTRSCYGRRLAELEILVLVTKLLSKYTISTDVKQLKMTRNQAVLRPTDPLQIKFTRKV